MCHLLSLPLFSLDPLHFYKGDFQDQLFRKAIDVDAFRSPSRQYGSPIDHFVTDACDLPHICRWTGVKCIGGVMNAFYWINEGTTPMGILMEWLPPTLAFIRMERITMIHGWQPASLPRELRYFDIEHCSLHNTQSHRSILDEFVALSDLRMLPSKMEEFILDDSYFKGKLMLNSLPETMRLLYLRTRFAQKVIIDPLTLPETMEYIILLNIGSNKPVKTRVGPGSTACEILWGEGEAIQVNGLIIKNASGYKLASKYRLQMQ